MNEFWECYLCGKEEKFESLVGGFISNYHPLCKKCANKLLYEDHPVRSRMSYHYEFGDLKVCAGVPITTNPN